MAIAVLTAAAVAVSGWALRPSAPPARVDLRVLVVAAADTESTAVAWTDTLERVGMPYDVAVASTTTLTRTAQQPADPRQLALAADDHHARYQAVVVSGAAYDALGEADRAALGWLQDTFDVRLAVAYTYPRPAFGLTAADATTSGGDQLPDGSLTATGNEVFAELAGPVPIDPMAWGYRDARPLPGADWTSLVTFPSGAPAVGVHRDGGREQLVSLMDANPSMIHAQLLTDGMLRWLTRGVHLGYDRHHLSLHIDDVLLANARWDPDSNRTSGPQPGPAAGFDDAIRMTSADVDRAVAWSQETGIVLDLAFNGAGLEEHATDGTDPLFDTLMTHKDAFRWINHTYTHRNLDDPMTVDAEVVEWEVQRNLAFAAAHGIPVDATELVTGQHSGLDNPHLAAALADTPVEWVAADNSRQADPYALGAAVTVPRHPTNLYYDVATVTGQLDEYNHVYAGDRDPVTWEAYVDAEATIMLGHILTGDPRPHYLHQSNLAEDGLLYPVVDEVLDRYRRLFTTPLVQPTLGEAGALLHNQMRWQQALADDTAGGYLADGLVHIVAPDDLAVPVSGIASGQRYGPTRSAWVTDRTLVPDGGQRATDAAPVPAARSAAPTDGR